MDLGDVEWDELVARATALLRTVAARRATITYAAFVDALGVELPGGPAEGGAGSLAALLRQVSTAEDEAGRGLLTAVVVRPSGLPGGGFFRLAGERGRDVADRRAAWEAELRRVHRSNSDGSPEAN